MKKLILSAATALFILGSIFLPGEISDFFPIAAVKTACAESEERTEGNYKYVVRDNGTIKITEYIGDAAKVRIPRKIESKQVTVIGREAFAGGNYTKIVIPKGVLVIGERTFADCTHLKTVSISDTVKTINPEAFSGCIAIKSITLPKKLTKLQKTVFEGCTALKKVTVPADVTLQKKSLGYIDGEKAEDFEIRCYEGSPAQEYAEENEIDYTILASADETKATARPKTEHPVYSPLPTPYEKDVATEAPEEQSESEDTAKEVQEPNSVAAGVSVAAAIVAILVCIIIVARRRK